MAKDDSRLSPPTVLRLSEYLLILEQHIKENKEIISSRELADSYVQALNQGEVPHLQSAWNNVCTSNCENSIRECLKMFEGRVSSEVQLPMGEGRLRDIL